MRRADIRETNATSRDQLGRATLYGGMLFLICFLLANLEIQIEGPNGWASALPTWRILNPHVTWIFGGRPVTGYHVFLNLLLLAFFHFPLLFGPFSWDKERRILSGLTLIAVIWDFLWFVMNPHFGLSRYSPENVWWFKAWKFGFPVDYYFGILASFLISQLGHWRERTKRKAALIGWGAMFLTILVLTGLVVLVY
jgi:hypothetical protein